MSINSMNFFNYVEEPLDLDLYRIFPYDSFLKTVQNKNLLFRYPKCWSDKWELFFSRTPGIVIDPNGLDDGKYIFFDTFYRNTFAQCWSLSTGCTKRWQNYTGSSHGVMVKSKLKNIINAFDNPNNLYMGRVSYLSENDIREHYRKNPVKMNITHSISSLDPLFIKRDSFSYEDEFRITFSPTDPTDEYGVTYKAERPDNYFINFSDINIIFENITLDPRMKKDEKNKAQAELMSFGFNENKFIESDLTNVPKSKYDIPNEEVEVSDFKWFFEMS